MDTENYRTDSSPGAVATLGMAYETDPSPYDLSRFNACAWQTTRDDIMVCRGDRCPYRFCNADAGELPPAGSACLWEQQYTLRLLRQFDDLFPNDGIGRHMDDRLHHRREFVMAHLLSNRAGSRARAAFNEAMDAVSARGCMPIDREPFERHALAMRYRTAARNRLERVWRQADVIEARMRDERIRRLMIANGYWHVGDTEPLNSENAPEWIVRTVDGPKG
jgi:hypothetical protein